MDTFTCILLTVYTGFNVLKMFIPLQGLDEFEKSEMLDRMLWIYNNFKVINPLENIAAGSRHNLNTQSG